ncbi:MAG: asparagine synthase (glutamine-hydrolyzing), partial [Magnetococcales bacterium]|nr:asparagine synthase (glutamine-hydrolyzing) [Magnetococcales bacterium]
MCGILGAIGSQWRDHIEAALTTLDKRGPDEQGLFRQDEAILGHTRLAVIDAQGGHQPLLSPGGRHVLVFNGEIYNFLELRQELQSLGHPFTTRSDSEVLLTAYRHWGEAMLSRLDGMFAFAIWDTHTQTLFAARDRLGIKPFFYSKLSGLIFASTLAPFFRLPGFPLRLQGQALRDYLAFQTPSAPDTFLSDCQQLPPGHQLHYTARSGVLKVRRYWSIPREQVNEPMEMEGCIERVDSAIQESVRRQLMADVPLGAFLSGGIDSSLIVRYMAEAGMRNLRSFSLKFTQKKFDESSHARQVAQRFGCEHHELEAP